MRVNVYAEELTTDIAIVTTEVHETGKIYGGIRFYLESSPKLHRSQLDDDRSAVTLWGKPEKLRALLTQALHELEAEL